MPGEPSVNSPSLVGSALLVAGVGLAAAFGDFLSITIPVPVGFLLFILALVILPTGDLMRLASEYIENARPSTAEQPVEDEENERLP